MSVENRLFASSRNLLGEILFNLRRLNPLATTYDQAWSTIKRRGESFELSRDDLAYQIDQGFIDPNVANFVEARAREKIIEYDPKNIYTIVSLLSGEVVGYGHVDDKTSKTPSESIHFFIDDK